MATYVIGDVQGCFASLQALLAQVGFAPTRDRLWLVGDLVNRGPASLAVLRFLRSLGDRATCVLGNHDLHLIARAIGLAPAKPRDTLDEVLAAPDRDELIRWLATRPLLYQEPGEHGRVLVHAGLPPSWTIATAAREARRVEAALQDPTARRTVLGAGAGGAFDPALQALTTIRTCHPDGTPCKFSGPPAAAPAGCVPWFAHPERASRGTQVLFGHWAALGIARGPDYVGLDSGCVWGGSLTALRLEDDQLFSVSAVEGPA